MLKRPEVSGRRQPAGPAFWRATFTVEKPGDTFLDLRSWGKGVVWVNGHCLGRFWNIGPTQTAYVPGRWLKTGANESSSWTCSDRRNRMIAGLDNPFSISSARNWISRQAAGRK